MAEPIQTPSEVIPEAVTLTPEQAADIWGGNKSTETVSTEEPSSSTEGETITPDLSIASLAAATIVEEKNDPIVPKEIPADFSSSLKKLFEEEVLFGFQDDKGELEVPKTVDELKEVIAANKEEWKKEFQAQFEKDYTSDLSPQIQSILDYGKKGGTNIEPLLQKWAKAEKISNLDETDLNQAEKIYKEYKSAIGESEEEYADELQLLKDSNKLTSRAATLKPKLIQAEEEALNAEIAAQEKRDEIAKKAIEQYKTVVKTTLQKGKLGEVVLDKQEQQNLFDLTIPNQYKTYSGRGSGFDKILEDLQFGDKQDYEHFLQVVKFASDKEGFLNKIKTEAKKDTQANIVRQLKTAKSDKSSFVDPNEITQKVKMLTKVKGMS